MLCPVLTKFYEDTGGLAPTTSSHDGADECEGRCIEMSLKMHGKFKFKRGAFRKRKVKNEDVTIQLELACACVEEEE